MLSNITFWILFHSSWLTTDLLPFLTNFSWLSRLFSQGSRRCPCIICRVCSLPGNSSFHNLPTGLPSRGFWHYVDTYSGNFIPSALLPSNCHQAVCSAQILSPTSLMGVGCRWIWRNCRDSSPRTQPLIQGTKTFPFRSSTGFGTNHLPFS